MHGATAKGPTTISEPNTAASALQIGRDIVRILGGRHVGEYRRCPVVKDLSAGELKLRNYTNKKFVVGKASGLI
jgi:hypothetical protein